MYDFEITRNEGFVKLKALNKDAIDWMRITIFKPCGVISPVDLDTAMLQHNTLEGVLRSIMAGGYSVEFKTPKTAEVS